jgi:hypothetical protein
MAKNELKTTVLGIHSNVSGDAQDFTSGHAWISINKNGTTEVYGLWPDAHPRTIDNGDKSDIRSGLESKNFPKASRFYKLNVSQEFKLNKSLTKNVAWKYTNTCASWATEIVNEVTGVSLDADDWGGFETPRELGTHILVLEMSKGRTSLIHPATPAKNHSSW